MANQSDMTQQPEEELTQEEQSPETEEVQAEPAKPRKGGSKKATAPAGEERGNAIQPAAERPSRSSGDDLVEYTAPLLPGGNNQDVFVAVNGESIRIKRGEPVMIKRKFFEVLKNAAVQERAAYNYMAAAKKAGQRAMTAM